jgi:hypothetical protein
VGKVLWCFLHESSFLTVRGNQRQFFKNTVLATDELIIHSLIVMYHLHLLLCHIQLYQKMALFTELEILGRKCNGLFQSKQTSERMKPQSLFSLSWLRFKLATLTIQVTSITVWANLLIIRGEEYMLLRDDIIQTNLFNKGFLIYIICENVVLRNFITLRVETSWKSEHYGKICWKWNVWYGLK